MRNKQKLFNFKRNSYVQDLRYRGVLKELRVDLLHDSGCERYPYLEMEETCAQVI